MKERVAEIDGCYVAETRDPKELSELLRKVLMAENRVSGRERIIKDGLDNVQVAQHLMEIYQKL